MTEVAAGDTDLPERSDQRPGRITLASPVQLLVYAWAAALAAFPLNDNSFLTHLATGRLILERGAVPTTDPYSFTANGEPWTVQSWIASVLYAGAERLGGGVGLKLLVLAVFLLATHLLWRVTAPAATVVARLVVLVPALAVSYGLWSARPYMMSVIGVAVVWLALDGRVPPVALAPLLWVWANTHGGYPLAVVLILAVMVGERLDHRPLERATRVLGWTVLGMLAATIGPLGLRVLTFPVSSFGRSEVFAHIIEWQAPSFVSFSERAFLVVVAVAIVGLVRAPRWRHAVPVVLFTLAALVAQRNIVVSTVVLAAVSAASLREAEGLRLSDRRPLVGAYSAVGALALVGALIAVLVAPVTTLGGYPVRALAWLDATRVVPAGATTATQGHTGNLLTVLDGPEAEVFVDDRVDMYPVEVFFDGVALTRGEPEWSTVLDRYDIDVVVWERDLPLGSLTAVSPEWRTVYSDSRWVVVCRRSGGCEDRPRMR